jgi:hypothetical protein
MKKAYLLLYLTVTIIYSCGNNKADQPVADTDTVATQNIYYWQATDTGRMVMNKKIGIGPDSLTPQSVTRFLNTLHPNVQLVFTKKNTDTVLLDIPQAAYLTQQMGSSGSLAYLAETVYNLTEIPGVNFVTFNFEEGDHAQPGTYSKESFKDN